MSGIKQKIFDMLMESQFWPQEQMLEFQRSQLAQLLRHAKATRSAPAPGGKFIQYKSELQDHSMAIGRESNG